MFFEEKIVANVIKANEIFKELLCVVESRGFHRIGKDD